MQYETNKLASTWMVGKRKQNYYSMHYIQKYKQNLEIEIFGPLVIDTHIKRCLIVYRPILCYSYSLLSCNTLFYTHKEDFARSFLRYRLIVHCLLHSRLAS